MKASLFADDEEDKEMFQDHGTMKVSSDVSSPRLVFPGSQSRGRRLITVFLFSFFWGGDCGQNYPEQGDINNF